MHRTCGSRAIDTGGQQVVDEVTKVRIHSQTVSRFDVESCAVGFERHDGRIRIEQSQVDQDSTLLDVMTTCRKVVGVLN